MCVCERGERQRDRERDRERERERETETETERDREREREKEREGMQCATASAWYGKYYKYCDQTYAAKHFINGNALSI